MTRARERWPARRQRARNRLRRPRPATRPDRWQYGSWSPRDLKAVLDDAGHGDYKTNGGKMHVSLDRILEAIASRDDDETDEGGDED